MSIKLSDAKKEVIALCDGSLEDMTDPQFIRFVNRAIVNIFPEITARCADVYELETTLTFATAGVNVALPSDIDPNENRSMFYLFDDSDFTDMCPGYGTFFWRRGSTLRFAAAKESGDEVYIQYTKKPNRYTKISEVFEEEGALEEIASEVQALYYAGIDENEPNASATNALAQASRIL